MIPMKLVEYDLDKKRKEKDDFESQHIGHKR